MIFFTLHTFGIFKSATFSSRVKVSEHFFSEEPQTVSNYDIVMDQVDTRCGGVLESQVSHVCDPNNDFTAVWTQGDTRTVSTNDYTTDTNFTVSLNNVGNSDSFPTTFSAQHDKLTAEMAQMPFVSDKRCAFVSDKVAGASSNLFYSNHGLLSHPDGPKEPNLCYIPPYVSNVLYNPHLCSSSNNFIYSDKFKDVVDIVGLDVHRTIDKDIGTPMCVVKFNESACNEGVEEYLKYLYAQAPVKKYSEQSSQALLAANQIDQKEIIKSAALIADYGNIIDENIDMYETLKAQLVSYDDSPNLYINDYVMHKVNDFVNVKDNNANGDLEREKNMANHCAYHGSDKTGYGKTYSSLSGVGSHITHLNEPVDPYIEKWKFYDSTESSKRKNEVGEHVTQSADFENVWDRYRLTDTDAKGKKCESIVFENEDSTKPSLGFTKVTGNLYNKPGNNLSFALRNEGDDDAKRYYLDKCVWDDLEEYDIKMDRNRRVEACEWSTGKDEGVDGSGEYNCETYGRYFKGNGLAPIKTYFERLHAENSGKSDDIVETKLESADGSDLVEGEDIVPPKSFNNFESTRADNMFTNFLLHTKNDNFRNFSRDGDRCIYRSIEDPGDIEGKHLGCVTESDLPMLPTDGVRNIQIYGTGFEELGTDLVDSNFKWADDLVVSGDNTRGYTISGRPPPELEDKLVAVMETNPKSGSSLESVIELGNDYQVIEKPPSGMDVAYVSPGDIASPNISGWDEVGDFVHMRVKSSEYNGDDKDVKDEYNYKLGEAYCVLNNNKMVVKKDDWINMNTEKRVRVDNKYIKISDLKYNIIDDPRDSSVKCELNPSSFKDGGLYQVIKNSPEILNEFKCGKTMNSQDTVHIDINGAKESRISTNFDEEFVYKFRKDGETGKGTFVPITEKGFHYIDNSQAISDITDPLIGNNYTYQNGVFTRVDNVAKCESEYVTLSPNTSGDNCTPNKTSCPDDGPGEPGLYHYLHIPTKPIFSKPPGVYIYNEYMGGAGDLQSVSIEGIVNVDSDNGKVTSASCKDVRKAFLEKVGESKLSGWADPDIGTSQCTFPEIVIDGSTPPFCSITNNSKHVVKDVRTARLNSDMYYSDALTWNEINSKPDNIINKPTTYLIPKSESAHQNQEIKYDKVKINSYAFMNKDVFDGGYDEIKTNEILTNIPYSEIEDLCDKDPECVGFTVSPNGVSDNASVAYLFRSNPSANRPATNNMYSYLKPVSNTSSCNKNTASASGTCTKMQCNSNGNIIEPNLHWLEYNGKIKDGKSLPFLKLVTTLELAKDACAKDSKCSGISVTSSGEFKYTGGDFTINSEKNDNANNILYRKLLECPPSTTVEIVTESTSASVTQQPQQRSQQQQPNMSTTTIANTNMQCTPNINFSEKGYYGHSGTYCRSDNVIPNSQTSILNFELVQLTSPLSIKFKIQFYGQRIDLFLMNTENMKREIRIFSKDFGSNKLTTLECTVSSLGTDYISTVRKMNNPGNYELCQNNPAHFIHNFPYKAKVVVNSTGNPNLTTDTGSVSMISGNTAIIYFYDQYQNGG